MIDSREKIESSCSGNETIGITARGYNMKNQEIEKMQNTSPSRLHYIDVAKGLLILIVVCHHVPHVSDIYDVDNAFVDFMKSSSIIYISFFMPAFFIITGYCTNFSKYRFDQYLINNSKTILLPAFCLGFISMWLNLLSSGCTDHYEYCKLGFRTLIVQGGPYWFLSSLFLSKMLVKFWVVSTYRMSSNKFYDIYTLLFFLMLLCLSVVLNGRVSNVWFFVHALGLSVFLCIGSLIRKYDVLEKPFIVLLCGGVYCVILLLVKLFDQNPPYITMRYNIEYKNCLTFFLLSIAGSLVVILVAKRIKTNIFLEYFGRNSLIIYCLHISVLSSLYLLEKRFTDLANFSGWISFGNLVITVFVLSVFCYVLNLKYFRYLIGKFS